MASEMAEERMLHTKVTITSDGASTGPSVFAAHGKTVVFDGWRRAFAVVAVDASDNASTDSDIVIPPLAVGDVVTCKAISALAHETAPPARLTEATLIERMEEAGIGRPSTYASTIETLLSRNYCEQRGKAMVPTWQGFAVTQLLERHLPEFIDYEFTARMESDLDRISASELKAVEFLSSFYLGGEKPGLRTLAKDVLETVHPREASSVVIGPPNPSSQPLVVRIGRFGPFVELGDDTVKLPPVSEIAPDELTTEKVEELLASMRSGQQPLGICGETGKRIYVKTGRFGTYVQRGENADADKKTSSIPQNTAADSIDLAVAIDLLRLPRTLGTHPETSEPVLANNGPYGPYVACGEEKRSLKNGLSPLLISFEEAIALLAEPKPPHRGRVKRRRARR